MSQNLGKESNADLYLHANQAGQAATIATVRVGHRPAVDHFVEVEPGRVLLPRLGVQRHRGLHPAFQGNHGLNLTDNDPFTGTDNSGFNAFKDGYNEKKGGAQYLHLGAAQSLAFVRSRDTLPVPTWGGPSGSRPSSTT